MNAPCQVPLSFYAGETFSPPAFTWVDINGNPINLTGYTATLTVRQTVNSIDPPVVMATTQNAQIVLGGTSGTIQVVLNASYTTTLPNPFQGVYDIFVYSASGVATRLFGGPISINEPVTRP